MSGSAALGVLLPGFVGPRLPEWLAIRLRDGLAGVCLFATNIESPEQLRELTAAIRAANPFAVIAIDEEGGEVTRLYQSVGSPFPGNALLGRIDDEAYTEQVARTVGWELRRAGCTLDFAPDVDINSNDANPVIGVRSFGASPELVARHSAAWVRGLQSTGIAACAKHFPGHGDTAQDSHLALPIIDLPIETLRERELLPFAAAIAAGAKTIMTSHILLPQLDDVPATFSARVLEGLLRGELGFDGVIVSDALDMKGASGRNGIPDAAVRALAAGCDLLCIGTENTDEQLTAIAAAIDDAVAAGAVPAERLGTAIARVSSLTVDGNIPIPEYDTDFDAARTADAFDGVLGAGAPLQLFQLETAANIAVGDAPWGLAATGAEFALLREGDRVEVTPGLRPVFVGRDNHRHAWVRSLVDGVRGRHPSAVVVDVGWPSSDRRYADLATFGASRHTALALLAALHYTDQEVVPQ
jgi:beta-N-acetylhexosaminidase